VQIKTQQTMSTATTGWRRINQTIYFCRPSSVFLQQNT